MQFADDGRLDDFRREVREFLQHALPDHIAKRGLQAYHERKDEVQWWMSQLSARGWSAPNWPVEYGGTGWSPRQQLIFDEESMLAGAPQRPIVGLSLVAPVLMAFGSQAQRDQHLPKIRSGECWWGQCFSESEAGSDLASMATRAVREGDGYRLNGSKIWTTLGQYADWAVVLAKTDTRCKPQKGISFFLVDLSSPGVTCRPIISLEKGHTLNEFHFDNVLVPLENRVGEEGEGWRYAKYLLHRERAWSAEIPRNKALFQRVVSLAKQALDGPPRIDDPVFLQRLTELEIELQALEFLTLRAMAEEVNGDDSPWQPGAMLHIKGSELQQALGQLMMDALGSYAANYYPDAEQRGAPRPPGPKGADGVAFDFLYRHATTIYGGSNEIQRNIIAGALLKEGQHG
ncbi:acyl-CoA dehydrogenase [Spongiibacter sp. KMU-166]|uniref:Acyl-CoA dehydrogenase n=1 Tax=Spongiibacter thalassae TaxID=2721624 RepID=A0ABX1GBS2_9GAMM|nr:acyl-CoA dehydrogenase family protein [Spongiibacter thalassae]NKI16391.1 acyl-CoA dehydrogenase [Spongiibacter thalassae]